MLSLNLLFFFLFFLPQCFHALHSSLSLSLSIFAEFAASQRAVVTMATMENKKTSCFTSAAIASNSDRCGDGVPAAMLAC